MKQSPLTAVVAIVVAGIAGYLARAYIPAGWHKLAALRPGRPEPGETPFKLELLLQ